MTRASTREYSDAVRWRYLQVPRKEKTKILDEFTKVTGYHRKAIIRLLHRVNQPNANRKRGHPRQYSATVVGALVGFGRTPCPSTKEDQNLLGFGNMIYDATTPRSVTVYFDATRQIDSSDDVE